MLTEATPEETGLGVEFKGELKVIEAIPPPPPVLAAHLMPLAQEDSELKTYPSVPEANARKEEVPVPATT
jgi:hypothetical protein